MTHGVVIVTGGSGGIGAAIAQQFADLGWCVAINYHGNKLSAEQAADRCRERGADVLLIQGNVANDSECRKMAATVQGRWGRIDALVNNAGVTRFCKPDDLDGLSKKDFDSIFEVNVTGAYQMTRACLPSLKHEARGSVVNISSHAGFTGLGSSMAYAASKAALNNLTLALARTLAPEVRVNAVCPGFVDTPWFRRNRDERSYQQFKHHIETMTPLGKITTADEVADSVVYLTVSATAITGQLLVLDGGIHLTVNAPDF